MHLGARLVPLPSAHELVAYDMACAAKTARVELETMYHEPLTAVTPQQPLRMMFVSGEGD